MTKEATESPEWGRISALSEMEVERLPLSTKSDPLPQLYIGMEYEVITRDGQRHIAAIDASRQYYAEGKQWLTSTGKTLERHTVLVWREKGEKAIDEHTKLEVRLPGLNPEKPDPYITSKATGHPELKAGEVFLGNWKNPSEIQWKTKRMGLLAYALSGMRTLGVTPVFVQRTELEQAGIDPDNLSSPLDSPSQSFPRQ